MRLTPSEKRSRTTKRLAGYPSHPKFLTPSEETLDKKDYITSYEQTFAETKISEAELKPLAVRQVSDRTPPECVIPKQREIRTCELEDALGRNLI